MLNLSHCDGITVYLPTLPIERDLEPA